MAVYILVEPGQSNMEGADNVGAPAGFPDASIPFWWNQFYYNDGPHVFAALNRNTAHGSNFSHELQTAKRLKAVGLKTCNIKLTQGATYISMWLPDAVAGYPGSFFYTELAEALAAVPAQFPGETDFEVLFIWDQGEAEARYFDQPTVERWTSHHATIKAAIEAIVGKSVTAYVVRTCSTITGKTFPGVLEACQAAAVAKPHRLINTNDLVFQGDNVHRTGASQNIVGDRIADAIIQDIFMGSPTEYAGNKVLDHFLGGGDLAPPGTYYAACFKAGFECTQIARKAITNNTTNFPAATSRTKLLAVAHTTAAASGDAGDVDEIRLFDASSGGNEWSRSPLAVRVTVNNGGTLTIPANGISITLPAGAFTDYAAHKALDLLFGGVSYTRPSPIYFSGFSAADAEITSSRKSVTNNATNFPGASSLLKTLAVTQAHAPEGTSIGTVAKVGIYDASSGGNRLFYSSLITPRPIVSGQAFAYQAGGVSIALS